MEFCVRKEEKLEKRRRSRKKETDFIDTGLS